MTGSLRRGPAGLLAVALLALAACENSEQIAARESQFNGKALDEVIAVIGRPTELSRTEAAWSFRETYVFHSPNTVLIDSKLVTVGTTPHEGVRACTYRATLAQGHVVSSTYQGNGCARYAPKLPG